MDLWHGCQLAVLLLLQTYWGWGHATTDRELQTRTFASGFEASTTLTNFQNVGDSTWRAYFSGTDASTGYNWWDAGSLSDLPGVVTLNKTTLRYQVHKDSTLSTYVTTALTTTAAYVHAGSKGLLMTVVQDDPAAPSGPSRTNLNVYPETGENWKTGYTSYWVKLQSDLATVQATSGQWRQMVAISYTTTKTVAFQVVNSSGTLIWRLFGKPCTADCASDWTVDNSTDAVPIDTWFLFEFAWTPGRYEVKVDGTTICAYTSTVYTDIIDTFTAVSLYSAVTEDGTGAISQAVDDLTIKIGPAAIAAGW